MCAPERVGFRSQGTQMLVFTHQPSCSVAYGILDHPPEIEPMSLALQDGKSPSQKFFRSLFLEGLENILLLVFLFIM